ncbi:MAG TPA: tRNA pseudouridine(38-40) synthase TruA [Solirubrobacterales bacterium]|nr:tRNA pseudouridine(38-40) synthase TruA [Solirubrobacterales bacterium]
MTSIRLTLAYHGGGFAGWAAQPGLRTVQGELEAALARILPEPVSLTVAGRTDAGVHAWGQVASFECAAEPPDRLAERVNAVAPPDLSVLRAEEAPAGFDARRDARSRVYCYWVLASPVRSPFEEGRALWWPHPADADELEACAGALVGTHDFTAFTPTESEHVRFGRDVITAEWRRHPLAGPMPGELVEFWIEADAFMRHMVRVLVGTMLEVGGGRRTVAEFERLLGGAPREAAGPTAPPHGLYLASVRY